MHLLCTLFDSMKSISDYHSTRSTTTKNDCFIPLLCRVSTTGLKRAGFLLIRTYSTVALAAVFVDIIDDPRTNACGDPKFVHPHNKLGEFSAFD